MPLSRLQGEVLKLLALNRDPQSFVAGSTPLNRGTTRYSGDIDIFHDQEERVAAAALNDAQILEDAGYEIAWIRRLPSIHTAQVKRENEATRLERVVDSDYRFFPAIEDELAGFVLHPIDLALNKALAAAGRREVRDIVDLLKMHETTLPLGAIVWAAVDKSPGFTPEGLIAEIRRNLHHPTEEWRALDASEPIDPANVTSRLRVALDEARDFVTRMPTDQAGLLFLENGKVVQPDPDHLGRYQTHSGRRRGHWPSSIKNNSAGASNVG